MSRKLHIVYATDERYLLPTRVAAASAIHHASRKADLVIDILDCEIPDAAWEKFEQAMRKAQGEDFALVRHRVDMRKYDAYKLWHTSRGIYARLDIPEILGKDIEWCIYADGDTLFVDDPFKLEEVYNPNLAIMGHLDDDRRERNEWYDRNGFKWDRSTYFCAGFILINMVWAREHDLARKSIEFIDGHRDVPMNDQDALNILCQDSKGLLPPGWGVFASDAYWKERPHCIHFVGERAWELPDAAPIYLPTTTRLWFEYAFEVAKIKPREVPGFSRVKFALNFIRAKMMYLLFCTLSIIPGIGDRYEQARNRLT